MQETSERDAVDFVYQNTGTCTPKATKKACGYNFFPTS